jgi:hypothetical protein
VSFGECVVVNPVVSAIADIARPSCADARNPEADEVVADRSLVARIAIELTMRHLIVIGVIRQLRPAPEVLEVNTVDLDVASIVDVQAGLIGIVRIV